MKNKDFSKVICIKNHDDMVETYNKLNTMGKNNFYKYTQILKNPLAKSVVKNFIEANWIDLEPLLKLINSLCQKMLKKKVEKDVDKSVKYFCKFNLNKIKTKKDLEKSFYKIIEKKDLYKNLLILFKMLSNVNTCLQYLSK